MSSLAATVQVLYNTNPLAMGIGRSPGDQHRLVHVFDWAIGTSGPEIEDVAHDAARHAFDLLNHDHPDHWADRSMSVGDVVILGEVAVAIEPMGFSTVPTSELSILDHESGSEDPTW